MPMQYANARTRVTLYGLDGIASRRYTLQKEKTNGLRIGHHPEGKKLILGSGSGWTEGWGDLGNRKSFVAEWDTGGISTREYWSTGSSTWVLPEQVLTAEAVADIIQTSASIPCSLEPHIGDAAWQAQPPTNAEIVFTDQKGVVYTGIKLMLDAVMVDNPVLTAEYLDSTSHLPLGPLTIGDLSTPPIPNSQWRRVETVVIGEPLIDIIANLPAVWALQSAMVQPKHRIGYTNYGAPVAASDCVQLDPTPSLASVVYGGTFMHGNPNSDTYFDILITGTYGSQSVTQRVRFVLPLLPGF